MAVPHGWYAMRTFASTTSYCIDFGQTVDTVLFKNEDASIAVWIRLGDTAMPQPVAAAAQSHSFRVAAGESVFFEGLGVRYLAVIAESGNPNVKTVGYCTQKRVLSRRG